jgi:hypothetical protein
LTVVWAITGSAHPSAHTQPPLIPMGLSLKDPEASPL